MLALGAGMVQPVVASDSIAELEPASPFTLQGFGTAGIARSTTRDVQFVRDLSQPRGIEDQWSPKIDSVFGLQASWRISPQLLAVTQAMSRYGFRGDFTPEISWAYLNYDPTPNLSLRAGRLGTEFFMMADSRWVGYSFLTVRPPGDYFWYLPFYSIYGGDAAVTQAVGEGVLRAKMFYGLSTGQIPLASELWNIDGSPMMGAYLEYQIGGWQVRGSYANIRFARDLPIARAIGMPLTPMQADALRTHGTRSHYYALGVVYDHGPWQAQFQLNHIDQGTNIFQSSEGGYALVGYRVGTVTPYVGYSWVHSNPRSVPGNDPLLAYVMADATADQQTTFAGMRWDFARNLALKAQWDSISGTPASIFPYRNDNRAAWDGKTQVFSLALDFVF